MSSSKCLFCRVGAKEIKSEIVGESELAVAFKDIHPKAPVHILVVPKTHYSRPDEMPESELKAVFDLGRQVAKQLEIAESGYRLVFNVGADSGQEVDHAHLHILGGRRAAGMF